MRGNIKRPLEILKEQLIKLSTKADENDNQSITLSPNQFAAFRANFATLCYETKYGKLDDIYQELFRNREKQERIFYKLDLNNALHILEEIKSID